MLKKVFSYGLWLIATLTGLYLLVMVVWVLLMANPFSQQTKAPSQMQIQTFAKSFGLGSMIFTIGETSMEGAHSDSYEIYRVTEIKGDIVFLEKIQAIAGLETDGMHTSRPQIVPYAEISHTDYDALKTSIAQQNVLSVNGDNSSYADDAKFYSAAKENPSIKFLHGCHNNTMHMVSKKAVLAHGELSSYVPYWYNSKEVPPSKWAYIDVITKPNPSFLPRCAPYGDSYSPSAPQ